MVFYVAVAEYFYPTIARDGVVQDLIALNNAAKAKDVEGIFDATADLVNLLQVEAQATAMYGLFGQTSPLAFQEVQREIKELSADRRAEQRIILAAQKSANPVVRAQVKRHFDLAAISTARTSIQASRAKLAQLNTLQQQSESYFSPAWVQSFAPLAGVRTGPAVAYDEYNLQSGEFGTSEYEGIQYWRSGESYYLDFDGYQDGGDGF